MRQRVLRRVELVFAGFFLLLGLPNPGAAQTSSGLSVVSTERVEALRGPGSQTLDADKENVILIVKVRGLTREDLNLGIRELYVKAKAGDFRYQCVSFDVTYNNPDGSWRNNRELVFVVTRTVTSFALHVGNKVPMPFSVTGPIKRERRI